MFTVYQLKELTIYSSKAKCINYQLSQRKRKYTREKERPEERKLKRLIIVLIRWKNSLSNKSTSETDKAHIMTKISLLSTKMFPNLNQKANFP